jgi:hypothetical protein
VTARSLDEVVDELYGLDPAEFTARRDARAAESRQAGNPDLAAEVKALRRPTAAAWVVNLLARSRPEEVARLVELGAQMREAQASLAGEELRALSRQRQRIVVGLGREAARLARDAGHPASDAVARDVQATLDAALADEGAGAAVRSGRLMRPLEHRGMEAVDLDGAVAGTLASVPGGGKPRTARKAGTTTIDDREAAKPAETAETARERARQKAIAAARAELSGSEDELKEAQAQLATATQLTRTAETQDERARQEVERLQTALDEARTQARAASQQLGRAGQRRDDAEKGVRQAEERREAAVARLRDAEAG